MAKIREPHPDDVATGKRLREARKLRGMSQELLAEKIGVTFQQIQKYEKGTNRIGASRLIAAARALQVGTAALLGDEIAATSLPPFGPQTMEIARMIEALPRGMRTTIGNTVRIARAAVAPASERCPHTIEMFPEECAA